MSVIGSRQTFGAAKRGTGGSSSCRVVAAKLATVKGHNILFSPARRAIFVLNETAAEIWRCLEEGLTREAISAWIASCEEHRAEAAIHVDAALLDWEQLGLVRPAIQAPTGAFDDDVTQHVALPGLRVRIVYPRGLVAPASQVFRHLETEAGEAEIVIRLVERGDTTHLLREGEWQASFTANELATVLKDQLLTEVLDYGSYELALHAAAVAARDRMMLLCGEPGAGKTTLTMALIHDGFRYGGDDVALLDGEGRVTGLPFAPAVKAGAWSVLDKYYPLLRSAPIFRRPDGKRVRYPSPAKFVPPGPIGVGWVVMLRRARSGETALERLTPPEALRGLLSGSFARGSELSGTGFTALTRLLESADAYCLKYANLDQAVRLLREACR